MGFFRNYLPFRRICLFSLPDKRVSPRRTDGPPGADSMGDGASQRVGWKIIPGCFSCLVGALSAGQNHHGGSQQSGGSHHHDPQSSVALIAGLDTGLVVGISRAADGALAVLILMAGGLDDLALLDGLAVGLADHVAGVAVLGAGRLLGANDLGIVAGGGDDLALGDDLAADLADTSPV